MACEGCSEDVYREQLRNQERLAREYVFEAAKYKDMWQAAASCLSHNAGKINPRGTDEKKIIELAQNSDHGRYWSGKTNGNL